MRQRHDDVGHFPPAIGGRVRQPFTIKREISIGVLLQLLGLLVSGIYFAARIEVKLADVLDTLPRIEKKLEEIQARQERIESYLASKDPNYWAKPIFKEGDTSK